MSQNSLSDIYADMLREEGYRPIIDSDGDIRFKREGSTYLIVFDGDDHEFFRLVYPSFYQIDNESERRRVEQACNEATRRVKAAKVWLMQDIVSASVEMIISSPAVIAPIFPRLMKILRDAEVAFKLAMRSGSDNDGGGQPRPAPNQQPTSASLVDNGPMVVSPAGDWFAMTSADNAVLLCDSRDGSIRRRMTGHRGSIRALAVSADGRRLASASADQSVLIWNTADGTQQARLSGHSDWVRAVAFAPDSRTLASSSDDKTVRLWDVETGRELRVLRGHSGWVRCVAFSTDGQQLMSGDDDGKIRVWRCADGELQQQISDADRVLALAASPDGQLLAASRTDGTVNLWRTADWSLHGRLREHSDWVRDICFSPDSNLLACASDDRSVSVVRTETASLLHRLDGHERWVRSVAFDESGKRLISGADDGQLRIWDATGGHLVRTVDLGKGQLLTVRVAGDRVFSRAVEAAVIRQIDGEAPARVVDVSLKGNAGGSADDLLAQLERMIDDLT